MNNKYQDRDFRQEDLPNNRFEQFKDIVKNEWRALLYIGLFLLLTSIPLIAFIVYKNSFIISLKEILANNNASEFEQYLYIFLANIVSVVIEFLLSIILIIGLSGVQRILRNLAWQEGVLFKSDFIEGIKKNILSFFKVLIVVFVIILITAISNFLIALYLKTPVDTIVKIIIDVFVIFVFLPMLYFSISMNTIYELKLAKTIINSFALAMRYYLPNLPFVLLLAGLYFVFYIPNVIAIAFTFVILITVIVPLLLLGWYLFHVYIYDKTINESYKDYQYKGLYIPKNKE